MKGVTFLTPVCTMVNKIGRKHPQVSESGGAISFEIGALVFTFEANGGPTF